MMMKKIIALAAAMLMSIGITTGLAIAAKAEGEQARMLANYHNAVRNEAFYCEAYTVSTQQGTDLTKAEEVIAKSNMADYAIVNASDKEESEAAVAAKEMASVCDDDIEAAVAKYKKEHTPAVSTTAPSPASIAAECASRPGMYGRLRIPSVGINVAVFSINSQATIDARDSAAIYGGNGGTTIADHSNQGFSRIANCVPGSTVAYIDTPEGTQRYICSVRMTGHNVSTALTDDALNVFTYGGLIMYTCRDNSYNIWIVCFDPA